MCGIVGCVGMPDAQTFLLEGLSKLEYRGYDSAGVAIHNAAKICLEKTKGRLAVLESRLHQRPLTGSLGIGHTRWATHGEPSDLNSHPHSSKSRSVAVVHNGIIENYMSLKQELEQEGYEFVSDTDTETVAHLIDYYYRREKDELTAVFRTIERIEGSYALGILFEHLPDTLIGARKDSPLVIGKTENGAFIASDVSAVLKHTREFYLLEDKEAAVLTAGGFTIYSETHEPVTREPFVVDWDIEAAEKGGFEHFMLKEICEQPKVVRDTLAGRTTPEGVHLEGVNLFREDLADIHRIYIVACGTAYHAGLIGKSLIERMVRLPVIAEVASEFRYNRPMLDRHTLLVVVSQSGETADTLAALRLGKENGARTLAVVNVVGSSISREADTVLYTVAGPEISVASTKAFSAQVTTMYLLAFHIAIQLRRLSPAEFPAICDGLAQLPAMVEKIIDRRHWIERFAQRYLDAKNVFYVGRGLDYHIAMEGSLKLKEIAYLHSEAYAAGELKHGPIALIEPATLIIGVVTQEDVAAKTASNLKECKARGARVMAVAMEGNTEIAQYADEVFYIPRTLWMLAPLLANIPLQMFSYYMAVGLGNDVDKPRNLAKSVTVE